MYLSSFGFSHFLSNVTFLAFSQASNNQVRYSRFPRFPQKRYTRLT